MIRRLCCIAALVAAVLATSVPAARAATVSPGKWAPKFCTALGEWQQTISEKTGEITSALSDVSDLSGARDKLVQFLGEMEADTQDAIDALKRAGTPSSPNGAKIAGVFVKAMNAAKADFAKAKRATGELSTTDATAFGSGASRIGQNLTEAGDQITSSFQGVGRLDKGQKLENAIKKSAACSFLTGSST